MPTLSFKEFPFGGGFHGFGNNDSSNFSNKNWSPVLDSQDCINLYPEMNAGPDAPAALIGTPGYASFATVGSGPIRTLFAGNGKLFTVSSNTVYQVNMSGGSFSSATSLGTVSNTSGPAQILANGNDIIIVDGQAGLIYWANGVSYTQPFSGFFAEYMDTFYVALSSTTVNQVNVSNSLDGSTWNALNFAVRTGASDFLTGLAAINGQLWMFGQKNTEVWYNAGNPTFPFQRIQGATINVGCMARFTIAKMDNTVYWLGADDRGYPHVYRAQGLQPQIISTPAVEQFLSSWAPTAEESQTPSTARAFAYSEAGHNFYVLTPQANNLTSPAVVFDSTTGLWHRRSYWTGSVFQAPNVQTYCSVPGTTGALATATPLDLAGDGTSGNIYKQSLQNPAETTGGSIVRIRTAPHICNSNHWMKYRRFELDADIIVAGTGLQSTGTPLLDYSNDGGRTFQNGTPQYTLSPSGATGQGTFQKYYQMNLGRSRKRVFRIIYTSSTDLVRFAGAYVDANPGSEM